MLLALFLCLGMLRPPRAKAVAGELTAILVAGGSVAAAPVAAAVGALCLAAVGITFFQGYYETEDSRFYGSRAYEAGAQFRDFMEGLSIPEHIATWWQSVVDTFNGKGGMAAGDEFTVPAEAAEFIRQWAAQTYDFTAGDIVVNQQGIFTDSISFLFIEINNWGGFYPPVFVGTAFTWDSTLTFPNGAYSSVVPATEIFTHYFDIFSSSGELLFHSGFSLFDGVTDRVFGFSITSGGLISLGNYFPANGKASFRNSGCTLEKLGLTSSSISSTISGSDVLDKPISADLKVKVPDVPMGKVGDKDIPIAGELNHDLVLGKEEVVDPPITDTDQMVGDATLEDIQAATQDKDLGLLFVSKFPFCIPWDVVNAIKLLAAPPQVPRWEVDFLAPLSDRVGGWQGDTSIVIDFSDYEILGQLCRWVTTIMFIAALAMGTKKLIWTS